MRRISYLLSSLLLLIVASRVPAWAGDETKITTDELIAKHLASLGTPEARAAAHSCGVDGATRYVVTLGGAGQVEGSLKLGSDGRKMRLVMRFSTPYYMGEDFVSDGSKVNIAPIISGKQTILSAFFLRRTELLQEGLFGGTLTSAWPLLDLKAMKPNLRYTGLHKVDGRDLHELIYEPRKSAGDVHIRLYFEPDTFRHVMTVYDGRGLVSKQQTVSTTARSASGIVADEVREILTERFSDFTTVDGVVVPTTWSINLANDSSNSSEMRWNVLVRGVVHGNIDPGVFKVK